MAESPEPQQRGPDSESGTVITEPASKAGSKRSYASTSISKASWVTFGSPLWHKDRVPSSVRSLPPILSQRDMEDKFVNDGVLMTTRSRGRKKPIIPPYDAEGDKFARHYFKAPSVKSMMARNKNPSSQKNYEALPTNRSLNKLSFRKRCRLTPSSDMIKSREMDFINDAIITEKQRTKYKDIIPPYDANADNHCKGYFKRPDIKRLLNVTCSPRRVK